MATSRYTTDSVLGVGRQFGSPRALNRIRSAVRDGSLRTTTAIVRQGQRLDTIAGVEYGDSTLWWVIAAASNIGWGLQQPPGIVLTIPDLNQVIDLLT